jgi:preprotein translocase subunit SecE
MAKKQGSSAASKGANKSQQKRGGPVKFAKDVRGELKKVSWPDRGQLRQSTIVVIIIVLGLMAYVYVWDFIFRNLSQLIFA